MLKRSFFGRSPLIVAPDLLGKILVHSKNGIRTSGRIVEVEAYLGNQDPASHAYKRKTERNRVMFGPPGYAYVYFTYGSHFCMNVVTGNDGEASAVLIRALEPLEGVTAMKRRRKKTKEKDLTSGPGKLAQALGIDRKCYGLDLLKKPLWISEERSGNTYKVKRSPRIGIKQAVDLPYRFYLPDSDYLSRP